MNNNHFFCIGGHYIGISFQDDSQNNIHLLPSFSPFKVEKDNKCKLLFQLTVDDTLCPSPQRQLLRKFDTGNGDILVWFLPDGGYQYVIRNLLDNDCCLLVCNNDFSECRCSLKGDWDTRSFGLNNALMLAYAFAGSYHQTLLIHASCVIYGNQGFPFVAPSGTGKSTHTSLWMKHIAGTELLNDDNPIVRIVDNTPIIYGSPWSGKTPCYRNLSAPLGAVTQIVRAHQNSIERLPPALAFASLLPACSSMKWDSAVYNNLCNTLTQLIETTPIFTLHCRPDKEAALICHQALSNL